MRVAFTAISITSKTRSSGQNSEKAASLSDKKKAGFYLSVDLLERFNRKFYELKLAGAAIENKSALMELALSFALDDLDKGAKSQIIKVVRTE